MKKFIFFTILFSSFVSMGQVQPTVNFDDFEDFEDDASTNKCKENRFPWGIPSWGTLPNCISGGYYLIFEDDFNYTGFGVNQTRWKPILGVPRDFNFGMQKAWHLPENNVISDGTLKITGKRLNAPYKGVWEIDWSTNPPTKDSADFDYTTGEIWSKYRFHYGVYEIRCKIPKGKGFWPAFWTSWGNGPSGYGEIDIFEFWNEYDFWANFDPDKSVRDINTNMWHHDVASNPDNIGCSKDEFNQIDIDFSADFHVITMIYDPGYIAYLVDGIPIRYQSKYTDFSSLFYRPVPCEELEIGESYFRDMAMPDQAMHIVANLAIQYGMKTFNWPIPDKDKAPDADTPFPSEFEIDYIRHWKKFDCPSALYFPDKVSLNLNNDLTYNSIMGTQVTIDNTYFSDDDQLHIIYSDFVEFGNDVVFSGDHEVTMEYFSNFDCTNQGIITSGDNVYNTQKIKEDFYTKYENQSITELKSVEKVAVQYMLYDLNGRIMQQGKAESNIQFTDMKKGMYIYIEFDEQQQIVKHQKIIF